MSRNKHKKLIACCCCSLTFSWVVAPKGVVCVFECLLANLAFQEFFQAIYFHFSRTYWTPTYKESPFLRTAVSSFFRHVQLNTSKFASTCTSKWSTVSLFLTTFTANLSTSLSSSCCAWSISPIAGFQTSLQTWFPRTSESNVNFSMFELTPRLLPTFKLGY